jgi:ABC-2 type transport system permease protein
VAEGSSRGPDLASTSGVYRRLFLAQARGQAQYRASFLVDLLASIAWSVVHLLGVVVMFRVTRSMGGFEYNAALLMATMAGCGFSLGDAVMGDVCRISVHVRTGSLDALLIRPLSSLGQLITMEFAPRRLGGTLMSALLLLVAASRVGVHWTPARVLLCLVAVISTAVTVGATYIAMATVTFWWVDANELVSSVTDGGRQFANYPITVYGPISRGVFAFGLGYAFAGYYPTLALLERPDPLGLPIWLGWCSPLVALVAALLAAGAWRFAIRHYRSTGS